MLVCMVYFQCGIECVEDGNHRWPENTFFEEYLLSIVPLNIILTNAAPEAKKTE